MKTNGRKTGTEIRVRKLFRYPNMDCGIPPGLYLQAQGVHAIWPVPLIKAGVVGKNFV